MQNAPKLSGCSFRFPKKAVCIRQHSTSKIDQQRHFRTDFYVTASDVNSPVGLPPGLAEQVVKHSFYKWKPQEKLENEVPEAITEVEVNNSDASDTIIESPVKVNNDEQFTSSESYNGAVYDNYSWSQTISDLDIIVKVPENVSRKNIEVSITPTSISVKAKDLPLLQGTLCKKCKHTDAIWSLDKSKLEIHIEKTVEMWWDCLLETEPKLDLSKIDCSRPYEELSEEAQAKIQELTWNQERKRMGLPTSDELIMQEKLKKAWNVEGSPFEGPYDPNAVIFN